MKYSYETHYRPKRADGRITSAYAAQMELWRRQRPLFSALKNPSKEEYLSWQRQIRAKAVELLAMPPKTEQPAPILLDTVQREGYRVEKWEFYPDDVSAAPVLVLIPDTATADDPAPVVLCFSGSFGNKEYLAEEPLLPGKACFIDHYPERNRMGQYYAQNGMVAVCFDHLGMGERALDPDEPGCGWHSRTAATFAYMLDGYSYTGMMAFQAFCFLDFIKKQAYVNASRIATSGHSLGTETAIYMAMVSDEIGAVVFNDLACSHRDRLAAFTEHEKPDEMLSLCANYHMVPGTGRYFDLKDLCAAMAPRPLTMNEGGADEHFAEIRAAYAALGAEDKLQLGQYPKYTDPATRNHPEDVPLYGLSHETYFEHTYTDAPDHSFRKAPSVSFLKKHFGL